MPSVLQLKSRKITQKILAHLSLRFLSKHQTVQYDIKDAVSVLGMRILSIINGMCPGLESVEEDARSSF
jgi:hypothetical protein